MKRERIFSICYLFFLCLSLGDYVFPEIQRAWSNHQTDIINSIKHRNVQLSIDGQCDSPGHSATYCTVSAMDVSTNKILDYQIVDVKEVKNSQGKLFLTEHIVEILKMPCYLYLFSFVILSYVSYGEGGFYSCC